MIWPYHPLTPMLESINALTDVIEAYAGAEQLIKLRGASRHQYECRYTLEKSRLKALIAMYQPAEVDLPLWHDADDVQAIAGAATINVDTRYADYQDRAVLWDNNRVEMVDIASKTDSVLTLVAPVVASYSGFVMPVRQARMTDFVNLSDMTAGVIQAVVNWHATENYALTAYTPTQYKGKDVLEWPTVLAGDSVERQFVRPLEWLDYGTGLVAVDSRLAFARIGTESVKVIFSDRADVWNFRRWLHQKPFYLPSFADDMEAVAAFDGVTVTVRKADYALVYQQDGFKQLCLWIGGTPYYRQVVAVAVSGDTEIIEVDAAVTGPIGTKISFMPLVRMVDRVEINWLTYEIAEASFTVRGVK